MLNKIEEFCMQQFRESKDSMKIFLEMVLISKTDKLLQAR